MTALHSITVAPPSRQRSAVSNGSRLFAIGDGNSVWARRFKDLVADFAHDLGGLEDLSQAQISLIRRIAAISVELERREGQLSMGEAVDLEEYARVSGALRRLLETIGIDRRADPGLASVLRRLAAG